MSDEQELDALARRYLDLWQDQMTALAGDPEFAEALSRLMSTMGLAGTEWAATWSNWPAVLEKAIEENKGDSDRAGGKVGSDNNAPGATAAGLSPDDGGLDLGVIASRLAALEQRLDRLESAAPRKSSSPRRKARKASA